MYIKRLEIDKFKSFANKVDIPFMRGFTTIAGPNGSGKSNIIDAILFALGLATASEMREKNLSEFISLYTNKNEASVTVIFDTENLAEPELKIQRRIKKGSQGYNSVYYLNDKPTTLTEIHLVLDKYNVNPNSYNVIMQNEVYRVTDCTPGQRRKIIDEIAGAAEFDRRIERANQELDIVEKRVEKSIFILNEISSNLEKLEQEREQALKYKKLRDEKTFCESQITTVKYFDTQKSMELAHQNILEFNKKKKEEEVKLKDIEKNIEKTQNKFNEIEELVKSKGETKQLEVKKQLEEKKGEISRKTTASNLSQKNIQQNLQTIENTKNGIEKAEKKIEENNKLIKEKNNQIKAIEEEIATQKAERDRIALEVSGLSQSANEFIQKRNDLKKQLDLAIDEDLELQKNKMPLETDYRSYKNELAQIEETLVKLEGLRAEYQQKKDSFTSQKEELEKEIEDYRLIQENTMNELDKTKNEISSLAHDIRMAQQTIDRLEAQKRAFEESDYGSSTNAIMRAKLKGVHAPLVQLGVVDKEYSVALEIAMGGRMRNIVVEDDYVAQLAIEILKSGGLPRLTFLPLNKLKKAPSGLKLPKEKGVVDYAINLVDFDDEYLNAFFFALGETLIVEDYATAQKLMGKYRIVTLSGELFEKSGAITGGAIKKSGLKFSTGDNEEIENYKKRLKDFEKKFNTLEDKRISIEDKLEKIREDFNLANTEQTKVKIELSSLESNNKETISSIEQNENRKKELGGLIEKTDKKLNEMEEKSVRINENILKYKDEIEKIESQISEEELEKLKSSTQSLDDAIRELEKEKTKVETEINDTKRDIEFNKHTVIKSYEQTINTLLRNNEDFKTDIEKRDVEIKALEKEIEELKQEIGKLGDVLTELQKQRDEINHELINLSTQKGTYENNLERTNELLEAQKARRKELEPVMEEVRSQLIEAGIDISKLEPSNISVDELTAKINKLEKRMQELEPVNMKAIDDYDRCLRRKEEYDEKINTLSSERKELLSKMSGYEDLKKKAFFETYENINKNFKEIYSNLADGQGALILDNYDSPFEGGLTLEAQPRDKKKTRLEALSGGEKAITALAFVLALQKNSPAPFYAFDEPDKDLDPINIDKLAKMIKEHSKNTQFVVVSHRPSMVELSDRTIGVTQKEKGITKVTGIVNKELVNVNGVN